MISIRRDIGLIHTAAAHRGPQQQARFTDRRPRRPVDIDPPDSLPAGDRPAKKRNICPSRSSRRDRCEDTAARRDDRVGKIVPRISVKPQPDGLDPKVRCGRSKPLIVSIRTCSRRGGPARGSRGNCVRAPPCQGIIENGLRYKRAPDSVAIRRVDGSCRGRRPGGEHGHARRRTIRRDGGRNGGYGWLRPVRSNLELYRHVDSW